MDKNNCESPCHGCDYGGKPFVGNIECLAKENDYFRTALWTGQRFQVTLMSICVGGDIGEEMHTDVDQLLRIESGNGLILMGNCREKMCLQKSVNGSSAIVIPAGTWHNLINTGSVPLKLWSVYAPPQHPFGSCQVKKGIEQRNYRH